MLLLITSKTTSSRQHFDLKNGSQILRTFYKEKHLKPIEPRGKFNIGKNISQRPKEVRKREFRALGVRYLRFYTWQKLRSVALLWLNVRPVYILPNIWFHGSNS